MAFLETFRIFLITLSRQVLLYIFGFLYVCVCKLISRFNLKLVPPVICYLQKCLTKVHPKTFMETKLCRCEHTLCTPISTLLWVLCAIKTGFQWIIGHYFFHLFQIFRNINNTMLPFFNFQNIDFKTKTTGSHCCAFSSLNIIYYI